MKNLAILVAAAGVLFAQVASAGTITLTFDQLGKITPSENGGTEPISNYYNGGYAGMAQQAAASRFAARARRTGFRSRTMRW